jgi:hypothetical protein
MAKYLEATDQALAFAKQCPAPGGGVELRPIMDTSGGPLVRVRQGVGPGLVSRASPPCRRR